MKLEFMQEAIEIAKTSNSDVPIGAVIVKDDKIIAKCVNKREETKQTIAHAEILAIQEANRILNNWRLTNCDLYVALEPCPMCASAILQARIKNVYFGAYDNLNGAFGSKCDMQKIMNLSTNIKGGILEEECAKILKDYFENLRKC